jgi:putative oxidoreductase
LLILRFATGISLATTVHLVANFSNPSQLLEHCLIVSVVVLLWLGLWTPIAALAQAVILIAVITAVHRFDPLLLVAATLGVALAMLGPGAWSLDALLFGRKRIF